MTSVLAGRKVVVTRAAEQADDLVTLLEKAGAIPVVIPLIQIVSEEAASKLVNMEPNGLAEYDWLIVTSPNGAVYVESCAAATSATQVAAIGTATADVLRAGGVEVAFVPKVQSAAGLLKELVFAGNVLVVQAANAEPALVDGLRSRGAVVTVIAPYRTVAARVSAGQQLAALSADAVLFASGSAARAWVDVFGDAAPPVVVAIGPRTAAVVMEAGLKVSVVAADHSLLGMIVALEQHLSTQR